MDARHKTSLAALALKLQRAYKRVLDNPEIPAIRKAIARTQLKELHEEHPNLGIEDGPIV